MINEVVAGACLSNSQEVAMKYIEILSSDGVSNYVTFIAGLLVATLIALARKYIRKPSVLSLEKLKELSLIELGDDAKERLKVTYRGEPVDCFHLTQFEMRNKSGVTIDNIHLKLYLDKEQGHQKLYEMIISDPLCGVRNPPATIECVIEERGEHYLAIHVPFLNDSKNNKDYLYVQIFSPNPIVVERLVGGGRGWMSSYFDRVEFNRKRDRIIRESSSIADVIANVLASRIVGLLR